MAVLLNFNQGLSDQFDSCREFVADQVRFGARQQKAVAAMMDYSPSDLSRKLAQSPGDSRRFTLDDLELYMDQTGDVEPVLYLVDKYLSPDPEEGSAKPPSRAGRHFDSLGSQSNDRGGFDPAEPRRSRDPQS